MELYFSPKAKKHIREIIEWYEQEKEGLGYRFLKEFEETLRIIQDQPLSGIVFQVKTRKVLVRKFPYKVFYMVRKRSVVIVAIYHHKKNIKRKSRT